MLAGADAIVARDAAGEINRAAAQIDALRFAGAQAGGTFCAGVPVDLQTERGPLRQQAEKGADRAEGAAEEPSA